MRIALDAMGGDHAPLEVVKGARDAAQEYGVEVVLVGQQAVVQAVVREQLAGYTPRELGLAIVDASEVVAMHESPASVVRQKKDSSIVVGMNLLKMGDVSGFVSAGNSGAMMAAALLVLGRGEGIERPALGTIFPFPPGPVLFLDVGANADCKPSFLVQFAHIGKVYMERVFGIASPRIGLLSSGEEETKGSQLVREAHRLLKLEKLNFIGNVEGKDLHKGVADVIVTDGFTGNIMVKVSEGLGEMLFDALKQTLTSKLHFTVASYIIKPALQSVAKRLDYAEYGGGLLLGVKGNVIIAHGRSDAKAIKNAIRLAKQAAERGLLEAIENEELV